MNRHLLVTNDFLPKMGGIQQYLWELWRRLDPDTFEVHTTPYRGARADQTTAAFDAEQRYAIKRSREPVLLPYPWLTKRLDRAAEDFGARLHVIDPAVPLGMIGPSLQHDYAVILHGAEVTVPGRLPLARSALRRVLDNATAVISAGEYALAEAERCVDRELRSVVVPPGVDVERFKPRSEAQHLDVRRKYGITPEAPFIFSVSRLVPRKGMDTLIEVAAALQSSFPDLEVCIGGAGRDSRRLARLIERHDAPVRLLGRLPEEDKAALYSAADIFAMLCRNRWNDLEQEGFGIVFAEAAAAGTVQIAGDSGGAGEAVLDGETGLVVDSTSSLSSLVDTFGDLLRSPEQRDKLGDAARKRAENEFSYDILATRLENALDEWTMS